MFTTICNTYRFFDMNKLIHISKYLIFYFFRFISLSWIKNIINIRYYLFIYLLLNWLIPVCLYKKNVIYGKTYNNLHFQGSIPSPAHYIVCGRYVWKLGSILNNINILQPVYLDVFLQGSNFLQCNCNRLIY